MYLTGITSEAITSAPNIFYSIRWCSKLYCQVRVRVLDGVVGGLRFLAMPPLLTHFWSSIMPSKKPRLILLEIKKVTNAGLRISLVNHKPDS